MNSHLKWTHTQNELTLKMNSHTKW